MHADHLCTSEAHLGNWPAPPPNSILAPPFFSPCQAAKLLLRQKPLANSSADLTDSLTSSSGSDEAKVKDDAEGGEAGVILDDVGSDLEVDRHWSPYRVAGSNSDEGDKESEVKDAVGDLPELTKDNDQDDGLTASSSSIDEAEEDKWNMTGSSSSGEAMDEVVRKSKRFVKRRVKGTRRPAESSDDEDEGRKQQRRRKVFSARVNPVPALTSSNSEDEALSEEINISSEWLTSSKSSTEEKSEAEGSFSEEINISSERRTSNKSFTKEKSKPAATPLLTESSEDEDEVQNMRGGAGQTYAEVLTEAIQRSGQHLVLDQPTPGDGNCCSYAFVQQCKRTPVKLFLQSRGLTIVEFMQLKLSVAQFIQANSNTQKVQNLRVNFEVSQLNMHLEGLRKRTWRQYWTDMQQDARQVRGRRWVECWADDIWLQAAAWFLNTDVHIIWAGADTQGQTFSITDGNWSPVAEGEERPRLYLGYIVRTHYQSLLPLVEDPLPKCVTQPAVDRTLQETLQNVLRAVAGTNPKQGTQVSFSMTTVGTSRNTQHIQLLVQN